MKVSLFALALSVSFIHSPSVQAAAAPAVTESIIKRTVQSPAAFEMKLKGATYGEVTVPEWCDQQVPYQDTEVITRQELQTQPQNVCDSQNNCHVEYISVWVDVQETVSVTKYRTEQYQCGEKTVSVLDHYWSKTYEVHFPAEAALEAGETEKIRFTVDGSEDSPFLNVETVSSNYSYEVASVTVSGGKRIAELKVVPFIQEKTAGTAAIAKVGATFLNSGLDLVITDRLKNVHVKTDVTAKVRLKGTTEVIALGSASLKSSGILHLNVNGNFDPAKTYTAELSFTREGIPLMKPVAFNVSKDVTAEQVDTRNLRDETLIGNIVVEKSPAGLTLSFVDRSIDYKVVRTQYAIQIAIVGAKGKTEILGEKALDRAALQKTETDPTKLSLDLKLELGMSEAAFAKLTTGAKATILMKAKRTAKGYSGVTISKTSKVIVP